MRTSAPLLLAALAIGSLATLCACAPARKSSTPAVSPAPPAIVRIGPGRTIGGAPEPSAVIYRTNGNYDDNVPVNVSAAGLLLSYPAPTDLRDASPLPLAAGFLLDRRGIGPNTAFTRYTYATYSALPAPPAPDSIMAAIIPGACVTESLTLPMTLTEALADTAAVNAYIRRNLTAK